MTVKGSLYLSIPMFEAVFGRKKTVSQNLSPK